MPFRLVGSLAVLLAVPLLCLSLRAQTPAAKTPATSDLQMVEKLILLRRDYQKTLEGLRAQYVRAGDMERAKMVEEELVQWHRIPKHALNLDLEVPPPSLQAHENIPDANKLLLWARQVKDKGWGTDYIDNQRRAELYLQELLTRYPQSNKISDAAYLLGDIYESKAYRQWRRSARYYERCYQWNPKTQYDARLRAAHLYDTQIKDRTRAIELYREITTHEDDPKRVQEATKRLAELSATK